MPERERSENSETGFHEPRWQFDCSRCKFSWCCGVRCACNLEKRHFPEPPPKRQVEMIHEVLEKISKKPADLGRWWGLFGDWAIMLTLDNPEEWRVGLTNDRTRKTVSAVGGTLKEAVAAVLVLLAP